MRQEKIRRRLAVKGGNIALILSLFIAAGAIAKSEAGSGGGHGVTQSAAFNSSQKPGLRSAVHAVAPSGGGLMLSAADAASQTPRLAEVVNGELREWWFPGEGRSFPEWTEYPNAYGNLAIFNADGAFDTKGHPFFEPIGENGRACISCHQPADGMSLSLQSIRERWDESGGKDPIFAAVDGANCPNLPLGDPASHSLLLQRGLFRVAVPWPAMGLDGQTPITPEFDIEVVRDPAGCNTDPQYGLDSSNPTISVYRRPRVAANLKYAVQQRFGVSPFVGKNGMPAARDPKTGKPLNMNMMADARHATLAQQAADAGKVHLQMLNQMTDEQLAKIEQFERQVYAAQVSRTDAGSLVEEAGAAAFGPRNLFKGEEGVLGNNITRWVFPMGDVWKAPAPGANPKQVAMRKSIRRGQELFHFRTFWIKDSMHLNTVGLGNPTKRTCATCHGMHMTGLDSANGWMDIGTTNLPWARETPLNPWTDERELMPLFKVTCKPNVPAHPYLGRVIYTQDPGRALISGKCNDVGTIVMQQFRGLASRAPYFSNGSAQSIGEMLNFYDRRYNIGFNDRERRDLENFLSSL